MFNLRLASALSALALILILGLTGLSCSNSDAPKPESLRAASDPPNGGGGMGGGDELNGGGGPPTALSETDQWNIVDFYDPRTGLTLPIVEGRVLVAFQGTPVLPTVDSNYFDSQLSTNNTYQNQLTYTDPLLDTDVQQFIAAENLTVFSSWAVTKGIGVLLPEGTSVLDAVTSWKNAYPSLILAVDPDFINASDSLELGDVSDDRFTNQWALNDVNPSNDNNEYAQGQNPEYDINMQRVWHSGDQDESQYTGVVVAVLDTGVQYNWPSVNTDLQRNSTTHGCNVGDSKASTTFSTRSSGGGAPWTWLLNESANNARDLGHGTSVAGVISAHTDNGNGIQGNDDDDIAGAAYNPKYFPFAVKARSDGDGSVHTTSSILNAYTALGALKGRYLSEYSGGTTVPYYNIEVANCSFSRKGNGTAQELFHLNWLGDHILFTCSAGNNNSGTDMRFPAQHPKVVSVAAYDLAGDRWESSPTSGSNYTADTDIAAPGAAIWVADMEGNNSWGHQLGRSGLSARQTNGTSFAAPYAAAVALVTNVKRNNPATQTLKQRLQSTAIDLPGPLTVMKRVDTWEAMYQ